MKNMNSGVFGLISRAHSFPLEKFWEIPRQIW